MARNPRNYPDTLKSPESGRLMVRGEKLLTLKVNGKTFRYRQPGWWCSLKDSDDLEGQLVDDDNLVADMARRTAKALAQGEPFTPLLIRAIRMRCKLSQREAGAVFGTGAKSFEKYESGEIRPSGPTKRLLLIAMAHPEIFENASNGGTHASTPDLISVRRIIRETRLEELYAPLFEDPASQMSHAAKRRPIRSKASHASE